MRHLSFFFPFLSFVFCLKWPESGDYLILLLFTISGAYYGVVHVALTSHGIALAWVQITSYTYSYIGSTQFYRSITVSFLYRSFITLHTYTYITFPFILVFILPHLPMILSYPHISFFHPDTPLRRNVNKACCNAHVS